MTEDKNNPQRDVASGKPAADEFLDDTTDAHAMAFGVWKGFRRIDPRPTHSESKKEPHYFKMGYIIGYLLKLGVVAAVAWLGLPPGALPL